MKMRRLLLFLAFACCSHAEPAPPEVQVKAGTLRGKWIQSQFLKRSVAAFEGIPYAEPPVEHLRFQPPVPAAPWSGVKVADRVSYVCTQRDLLLHKKHVEGSEDCLYLNVYAPETVSRDNLLPVMVFVHGGGFFSWSGPMHGPEYLMDRDVVYVNFNYRLGPLGFLSTADEVIPGNYGLKDMVMALSWVRDNILSFGGDPGLITIFGESAGGAAVNHLTLSPLTKGLFHRAIVMSGSANAPWAFHDAPQAKKSASKLAALLDCPEQPSERLRQCLMTKSAQDIIGTDLAFSQWHGHPMVPFKPVAEPNIPGGFINRPPSQLIPHDVPVMFGVVSDEGSLFLTSLLSDTAALRDLNDRFHELGPLVFFSGHVSQNTNAMLFKEVRTIYFGNEPINSESSSPLTELFSDGFFQFPIIESIKQQSKHAQSPVYFYELEHVSKDRTFAIPFNGYKSNATLGMCHCDDLAYIFPFKELFSQLLSPSDRAYTDFMLDLFTTFAVTGTPTTDGSWTRVQNPDEPEYAYVPEARELTMRQIIAPERQRIWTKIAASRVSAAAASPNDEL